MKKNPMSGLFWPIVTASLYLGSCAIVIASAVAIARLIGGE